MLFSALLILKEMYQKLILKLIYYILLLHLLYFSMFSLTYQATLNALEKSEVGFRFSSFEKNN